ncbi:MAG: cell division protein FtsH, partial [Bdellovibrionota bacterium]
DQGPDGFLGGGPPGWGAPPRQYSADTARAIDLAIKKLMDDAYARATSVLTTNRPVLDDSAAALLARETLTESDLAPFFGRLS